jgi:hypothetical protein
MMVVANLTATVTLRNTAKIRPGNLILVNLHSSMETRCLRKQRNPIPTGLIILKRAHREMRVMVNRTTTVTLRNTARNGTGNSILVNLHFSMENQCL